MDKEKLERGNELLNKIDRYKLERDYWNKAIDYKHSTFEINSVRNVFKVYNFIPFSELKEKAIEYYDNEIDRLEKEFGDL